MSEPTNKDIIRIVTKWQESGAFHPLTCPGVAGRSCGESLHPAEHDGKVVLVCPAPGCPYVQTNIPAIVLKSEPHLDALTRTT